LGNRSKLGDLNPFLGCTLVEFGTRSTVAVLSRGHGAQIVYRLRVLSFNPCTLKSPWKSTSWFRNCHSFQRSSRSVVWRREILVRQVQKPKITRCMQGPESPKKGQAGQNSPPFGFQGRDDRGLPLGHESERFPFGPQSGSSVQNGQVAQAQGQQQPWRDIDLAISGVYDVNGLVNGLMVGNQNHRCSRML
jgi:hypothetical protein